MLAFMRGGTVRLLKAADTCALVAATDTARGVGHDVAGELLGGGQYVGGRQRRRDQADLPTAEPFIAAMTGVRIADGLTWTTVSPSERAGWLKVSPPRARSAPAEKYRPEPVTTMARTPSSASNCPNASDSARVMSAEKALWRSGRSSQMAATPPEISVSRAWKSLVCCGSRSSAALS
jgi:hypothetical protein